MARTVYCKKLEREAEGLEEPPMYGPLGRELFEHVSKEAWEEWQELSLKIVNEYHLDLSEKEHRKVLRDQLRTFFKLDGDAGSGDVMAVGTPDWEEKRQVPSDGAEGAGD
jgi:Fe-S cluster biosynthesis and repair protein YggX